MTLILTLKLGSRPIALKIIQVYASETPLKIGTAENDVHIRNIVGRYGIG